MRSGKPTPAKTVGLVYPVPNLSILGVQARKGSSVNYSFLKGFLAFSLAFSLIGLFLGGLATASQPRALESVQPALLPSSEAASQLPSRQEVITESDRQASEELRSSPPPGPVRQD